MTCASRIYGKKFLPHLPEPAIALRHSLNPYKLFHPKLSDPFSMIVPERDDIFDGPILENPEPVSTI